MKTITALELNQKPALYEEIARTLRKGGLVCFPAGASYRLAADLRCPEAVLRLMQSKRRSGHHPALVFISDPGMAGAVGRVPREARKLVDAFWPGPLTILLDLQAELPPNIVKTLTRATGKVGVRCPETPIAARLMREFGAPLLVSSANMERKSGAASVAQVRKNFQRGVDICIDAGDLQPGSPSTLVDFGDSEWNLVREGAIPRRAIEAALKV